jgi:hypothetical protein
MQCKATQKLQSKKQTNQNLLLQNAYLKGHVLDFDIVVRPKTQPNQPSIHHDPRLHNRKTNR